jgi:N-formylglutamate amidohydrolase
MSETFIVREPADESPIVVEVPHAGLCLDVEALAYSAAPARSLARDADLYVDELFADAPDHGVTLLAARYSRYVVDLNRGEDEYDEGTVVGGPSGDRPRGIVWRLTADGAPALRERLPMGELERRRRLYYRPYHAALRALLEQKRARFGFAVLLCAHSMPTPRGRSAPDLVPGTRGRTSADGRWIDVVDRLGREEGWRVEHDAPYRGGFSTGHYGRPSERLHAVQIELARRLYMDEERLVPREDGFRGVRAFAARLCAALVAEAELVHLAEGRRDVDP